jgi:hypothetical protein
MLPQIRSFLEADYPTREEMLETFRGLVKTLEKPADELQKKTPNENALYLASLGMASVDLRDKKIVKAFLNAEDSPTDDSGNPEMLSTMFSTWMMLLMAISGGLTGLSGKDAVGTHFNSLLRSADKALGDGTIRTPADLRKLIPLIDEIEKELAQFPPNDELEALLK